MSLASINYKGIIVVLGLIGGASVLWFAGTDKTFVHAIDPAELTAGAKDRANELAGASVTSTVFTSTGWEIDNTITNAWGGYQSFAISGSAWFGGIENGTYVFNRREYASQSGFIGDCIDHYTNTVPSYYGPIEIMDCGPGGAVEVSPAYSDVRQNRLHSWYLSVPTANPLRTPAWSNITTQVFYPGAFVIVGDGTQYGDPQPFTFSSATYPAGGTSRVRYYSPHTLVTYTNTILPDEDQNVIAGIRSTTRACLNAGSAPCFIGPTNTGSTYDGVASFPLVSTSAWRTVYTNWTQGTHSITNVTMTTNNFGAIYVTYSDASHATVIGIPDGYGDYYSDLPDGRYYWSLATGAGYAEYFPTTPIGPVVYWYSDSAPPCTLLPYDVDGNPLGTPVMYFANTSQVIVVTNIVAVPNESIFSKTNELAWHYSAMYRLRDMLTTASATKSQNIRFTGTYIESVWTPGYPTAMQTANGHTQCYNQISAAWPSGGISYPAFSHSAGIVISSDTFPGTPGPPYNPAGYHVYIDICTSLWTVANVYTNVAREIDWMNYGTDAYVNHYHDYGIPIYKNAWKVYEQDTIGSTIAPTTTVWLGAMVLPPLNDITTTNYTDSAGWTCDMVDAVMRWQQRACSNSIFDARYP